MEPSVWRRCTAEIRKAELAQRHQLQAVLRANIHTSAAEDALGAMLFVALKNRVDPALQAARGLAARLLLGKSDLHLCDSGTPVDRQDGNRQARVLVIVLGHLVMVQDRDLYIFWLRGPRRSPEITIDLLRRFFSIRHGIDDQPRAEGDVTRREDSGRGSH